MEQIQNHKSVDSQSIWLKSVRFEADWLDLTNPWLKEGIKSDPELIYSCLHGELCPLSLSSTRVDSLGCSMDWCVGVWVDVLAQSAPRLTSRLSSASNQHWLTLPQLQWSVSLGFAPPWVGSPVFCINKAQDASSKLVRVGLRRCCHCNTTIFLLWIKKLWRLYHVVNVFVWIPSIMLLMW